MAGAYHVHGPLVVKTGTGSASAYETLGIAEEGADVRVRKFVGEVKSDVAGPMAPAALQHFGGIAEVRLKLNPYDSTVLAKIRKMGDATGEGQLPTIGRFVTEYFKLLLESAADEHWRFPNALLKDEFGVRLSTKYSTPELLFFCMVPIDPTATAAKDGILYDHTTS